jgi:hypothetical protein
MSCVYLLSTGSGRPPIAQEERRDEKGERKRGREGGGEKNRKH